MSKNKKTQLTIPEQSHRSSRKVIYSLLMAVLAMSILTVTSFATSPRQPWPADFLKIVKKV